MVFREQSNPNDFRNYQLLQQDIARLTPELLIFNKVRTKRLEIIPVTSIIEEEDFLYDEPHRDSLAESMRGDRGQISPLTVRARFDENGNVVYDTIDGFHRRAGMRVNQVDWLSLGPWVQKNFTIKAWDNPRLNELVQQGHITLGMVVQLADITQTTTPHITEDISLTDDELIELRNWYISGAQPQADCVVLYDCSDEELYDLRVLAASSVSSIKFARMAQWMLGSFKSTNWSSPIIAEMINKGELTLAQVFAMTQQKSSGKILGLTEEEATELKDWATNKAAKWRRPVGSIAVEMRTVEAAAPELVQKVRKGGGGEGGRGVLTHARLAAVAQHLPGQWEFQRILINWALGKNFLAPDLDFLAWALRNAIEVEKTEGRRDEVTIKRILEDPESLLHPIAPTGLESEDRFFTATAARPQSGVILKQSQPDLRHTTNFGSRPETRIKYTNPSRITYNNSLYSVVQRVLGIVHQLNRGESLQNVLQQTVLVESSEGRAEVDFNNKIIIDSTDNQVQLTKTENRLLNALYLFQNIPLNAKLLSLIGLPGEGFSFYRKQQIEKIMENLIEKIKDAPGINQIVSEPKKGWYMWTS